MKRLLAGLLVAIFMVSGAGVAFAAETWATGANIVTPGKVADVSGHLEGATNVTVGGLDKLTDEQKKAVQKLVDDLKADGDEGDKVKVLLVGFTFTARGVAFYEYNDNDEVLYDFVAGEFDQPGTVKVAAKKEVKFTRGSPEDYENPDEYKKSSSDNTGFLSVRKDKSGSGSGCSILTLGAIALFLLPAFAVVRRRK
ncbi:MAG: hypothetical protein FWG71_02065 [Synergistaceae bacterium]|nr:hypothetical protein [Synergistaceae bacterium]